MHLETDPRHNLALLPVEKDYINGLKMIRYPPMMAAWVGDKGLACEQLAILVHSPGDLSYEI